MNICIVGMNQIFDVDIDKTNKPYLPLASGEWSLNTGISMAVSTGLVAVLLALYIGSTPLLATVVGSLLLGIAYSVDLPFLRWKKYPVLAMGCILSVRYDVVACTQCVCDLVNVSYVAGRFVCITVQNKCMPPRVLLD